MSERLTCKTLASVCDGSFVQMDSKEKSVKFRLLAEQAPKYEQLYKRLSEYEEIGTAEEFRELKERERTNNV